jgi:hypothetical protein
MELAEIAAQRLSDCLVKAASAAPQDQDHLGMLRSHGAAPKPTRRNSFGCRS